MLRSYYGRGAFNSQAPLSRKELIVFFYWITSPVDEDLVSEPLKVKCVSALKFLLETCMRQTGASVNDKNKIILRFE